MRRHFHDAGVEKFELRSQRIEMRIEGVRVAVEGKTRVLDMPLEFGTLVIDPVLEFRVNGVEETRREAVFGSSFGGIHQLEFTSNSVSMTVTWHVSESDARPADFGNYEILGNTEWIPDGPPHFEEDLPPS